MFRLSAIFLLCCGVGCSGSTDAANGSQDVTAAKSKGIDRFTCTSSSSATDAHLKSTRLDIAIDTTVAGKPTGNLVTGFDRSLTASSGIGFGVSHVRDTTESGHQVSEYKFDFGEEQIVPGSTGGTLTLPTAYLNLQLESSAALNVVTLAFTPSNATATYKCKQDKRKIDNGPPPDPLVFEGDAKDVVAKDSCAKDAAKAVMDALVQAIADRGLDIPDTFTFTKIDRTDTGFKMVVNGATVPVVVGSGCSIKSIDTSAAGQIGD